GAQQRQPNIAKADDRNDAAATADSFRQLIEHRHRRGNQCVDRWLRPDHVHMLSMIATRTRMRSWDLPASHPAFISEFLYVPVVFTPVAPKKLARRCRI